jgi:hypothetical protein
MTKAQLERKIAGLESINDQLVTELEFVDQLMRNVGFSHGLETVKATAKEIQENPESYFEDNDE